MLVGYKLWSDPTKLNIVDAFEFVNDANTIFTSPTLFITPDRIDEAIAHLEKRARTIRKSIEKKVSLIKSIERHYDKILDDLADIIVSETTDLETKVKYGQLLNYYSQQKIYDLEKPLEHISNYERELNDAKYISDTATKIKKVAKILDEVGKIGDVIQIGVGAGEIAHKAASGQDISPDDFNKLASDALGMTRIFAPISLFKVYADASGMNEDVKKIFVLIEQTANNVQRGMAEIYANIAKQAYNGVKIEANDFVRFENDMQEIKGQLSALDTKFKIAGVLSTLNVVFEGKTEEYGDMYKAWKKVNADVQNINPSLFLADAYLQGVLTKKQVKITQAMKSLKQELAALTSK